MIGGIANEKDSTVVLRYLKFTANEMKESDGGGFFTPGKKLAGWYAVEVPEDWSTLAINVQSSWLQSKSATFIFNK